MHEIIIGRPSWRNISAPLLDSMYGLRHEMFSERLGWDVESRNGKEKDWLTRAAINAPKKRHKSA